MSARDELAKLISSRHTMAAADAILDAGYRKPRTITTVEELDALPEGSIVMADWATHQRILGQWATFGSPATSQPELPATVIHEPENTRGTNAEATNIDYAMATAAALGVPLTEAQVREYIAPGAGPEAEATR